MVERMKNGALNLLVVQTILEVDFPETLNRKLVMSNGAYLYYYYQTGYVNGYPLWTRSGTEACPAIERTFLPGQRTTLSDCEVEVHRHNVEGRQHKRDDWEAGLRWERAEERTTALLVLWSNAFTACGMNFPLRSDEDTGFLIAAVQGRDATQDKIRNLAAEPGITCYRERREGAIDASSCGEDAGA